MTGKVGMGTGKMGMGNGDWGMRKKWGMRMWFFLPPKMVGNGDWGMGNGFQNGECIRATVVCISKKKKTLFGKKRKLQESFFR